ncbi:MAG: TonB family protein [Xenococcaceae cyanobacterium]
MSLSQIATQQREKEQKRDTKLLTWTVPISIALHLAALAFGANLPRHNTPEIVKEPIEVLTIEPEKKQIPPPKLPQPEKPKLIPPKVEAKKIAPKPVIKKVARGGDGKKPTLKSSPSVAKVSKPIAPTPKPMIKNEPIAPPPTPQPPTPPPEIVKRPLPPLPPLPRPEPQPLPTEAPLPNNTLLTQSNPNSSFAIPNNNPGTSSTVNNGQVGGQVGGTGSDDPLAKAGNEVGGEGGTGGDGSGGKVSCIECPKPDYPDDAREKEIEGKVRVSIDIDAEGNVMDVKIASSSGHTELDEAAIDKAREWKFDKSQSGKKGMIIAINFKLEDVN